MSNLKTLLFFVATLFAPIRGAIFTALALVVLDLLTGLWASRKQNIPVTSSGLKTTLVKLAVYEVVICLSFLIDTYLTGPLPISNVLSGLIGITELKSILENLDSITGGSLVKSLINALKAYTSRSDQQ